MWGNLRKRHFDMLRFKIWKWISVLEDELLCIFWCLFRNFEFRIQLFLIHIWIYLYFLENRQNILSMFMARKRIRINNFSLCCSENHRLRNPMLANRKSLKRIFLLTNTIIKISLSPSERTRRILMMRFFFNYLRKFQVSKIPFNWCL